MRTQKLNTVSNQETEKRKEKTMVYRWMALAVEIGLLTFLGVYGQQESLLSQSDCSAWRSVLNVSFWAVQLLVDDNSL